MIFNSNTTSLGKNNVNIIEGYSGGEACALALIESARNDYAMFTAMLKADATEINMINSGSVNESAVMSLHEAVGSGIFKKIGELLKKLAEKIKSIFHSFMAKINGLFMKDKDLVKKYGKEVIKKTNLNKMEVKWAKHTSANISDLFAKFNKNLPVAPSSNDNFGAWAEDQSDKYKNAIKAGLGYDCEMDELAEKIKETYFEDEETMELGETGTNIRGIMSMLETGSKAISDYQKQVDTYVGKLDKLSGNYLKAYNNTADSAMKKDENDQPKASDDDLTNANKAYEMASAYQTVMIKATGIAMDLIKMDYKQHKAAFMKAIAANNDKLAEGAIYLNAIAEVCNEEVDCIIASEIKDSDIPEVSNADTGVLDSDVKDDPDWRTLKDGVFEKEEEFDKVSEFFNFSW